MLAWVLQPQRLYFLLLFAVEPDISSATRKQDDKGSVDHKSSSHFNADFGITAVSGLGDIAAFGMTFCTTVGQPGAASNARPRLICNTAQ